MRVTSAIVLALIAGILSSASAQSIREIVESTCVRNGGPTAWENIQTGARNVKICISSVIVALTEEYHNNGGDLNAVLAAYCGRVETLDNCFRSFVKSAEPCIEPSHQKLVNISLDTTTSMLQFTCANANLVKAVIESTDLQCLQSKGPAMENCNMLIFNGINTTSTNLSVTEINPHEILPELEPGLNSQICSNILATEKCVVKVVEACEDKIFSTTLDAMYKYVNNDVPCENLPKSPKPESSTIGSVANAL